MKTLLLMRHAKSSWKEEGIPDYERPLNKRGLKDAPRMGKLLFEKELTPQSILSSSALRARLTAELLVESSQFAGEANFLDSFYLAEADVYLKKLTTLPDVIERMLIIGHNPGLEGLLQIFSGRLESLSTAAIAHLVLPIKNWAEINGDTRGDLIALWRPRDLELKHKE
ncbi:MAG: histidine phosphatase family protein [Anaerolineaceae bacterium]|nr:histidine phosphatase family protein [Anaerolineaceae bacterium]